MTAIMKAEKAMKTGSGWRRAAVSGGSGLWRRLIIIIAKKIWLYLSGCVANIWPSILSVCICIVISKMYCRNVASYPVTGQLLYSGSCINLLCNSRPVESWLKIICVANGLNQWPCQYVYQLISQWQPLENWMCVFDLLFGCVCNLCVWWPIYCVLSVCGSPR